MSSLSEEQLKAFEDKAKKDFENRSLSVKISGLDPDFIIILSFVAIPFDIILAVLAIFDLISFGISWVVGMLVSIPPLVIIGIWHYWRSSNSSKVKEDARAKFDKIIEEIKHQRERKIAEESAKKVATKTAKTAGAKATKEAGKQTTKQVAKKTATRVGSKVALKRGAIAFLGTSIPFIGMIPFYTLWVLSTLRD